MCCFLLAGLGGPAGTTLLVLKGWTPPRRESAHLGTHWAENLPSDMLGILFYGCTFTKMFILVLFVCLFFSSVPLILRCPALFFKSLFPRSLTQILIQLFPAFWIILAIEINLWLYLLALHFRYVNTKYV